MFIVSGAWRSHDAFADVRQWSSVIEGDFRAVNADPQVTPQCIEIDVTWCVFQLIV
jgi:hypothetical protein